MFGVSDVKDSWKVWDQFINGDFSVNYGYKNEEATVKPLTICLIGKTFVYTS